MRVSQYRDVYAEVRAMATSFHSCVDQAERRQWAQRANVLLSANVSVVCSKATQVDLARMSSAVSELRALTFTVDRAHTPKAAQTAPVSRANKYNRSPARAVRLRRTARSAMRSGYI